MIEINTYAVFFSFFASLIINFIGIKIILPLLINIKLIDLPNQRSSHITPTPKGAGIIIVFSFVLLYHLYLGFSDFFLSISLIILASFSLINDFKQLSPLVRFISHIFAVLIFLFLWPYASDTNLFVTFIPYWLDKIILITSILWFINLFNFMDGIDGISGTQSIIIGTGAFTSSLLFAPKDINLILFFSGFLAGSGIAFLYWNWHPAKVFLGDVGSIPIGLICAALFILLYKNDLWFCVFILFNYYLIDATFTLLKRLIKKEKFWKPHNDHLYQIAIKKGKKHSTVCKAIGIHGTLMIMLSGASSFFYSTTSIVICLVLSMLSSILLIIYFLNTKENGMAINE